MELHKYIKEEYKYSGVEKIVYHFPTPKLGDSKQLHRYIIDLAKNNNEKDIKVLQVRKKIIKEYDDYWWLENQEKFEAEYKEIFVALYPQSKHKLEEQMIAEEKKNRLNRIRSEMFEQKNHQTPTHSDSFKTD